jgi:peptidoglycan hydrolase CwlO-like protein
MRTRLLAFVLLLAAVATIVIAAPDSSQTSYLYKRDGNTYLRGNLDDLKEVAGRSGEFVWTRQGGREYLITDRAVLDSVRAAFAELDAKKQPLKEIERRLQPHERELDRVERRVDELSDALDDEELTESTRANLERQLHAAEAEMRAVEEGMRSLEEELERLERGMERIEEAAEAKFERIVERAIAAGKATRVD